MTEKMTKGPKIQNTIRPKKMNKTVLNLSYGNPVTGEYIIDLA